MTHAPRPTPHAPQLVAFAVIALFAWLLWAGESRAKPAAEDATPVPSQLGLWTGKPLEASARALEILETHDVALMEYHLGQEPPLWFARVAGFGNRAAFHPPELCYVGSHYEVLAREPITVLVNGKSRRLMRLVISQGKERYESWYWFTANDRVTPNYYQQQLWLVMDSIHRRPMSGTLVRISTPLEDSESTTRRLLAFVTQWDISHEAEATHGA